MTLSVIDFYTQDKLKMNERYGFLLENGLFCVLVFFNKKAKEFAFSIPKYSAFKKIFNDKKYKAQKLLEYSILRPFIEKNKDSVMKRWGLTEKEFLDLIFGLGECLIRTYSGCNVYQKTLFLFSERIKKFMCRLSRSKGQE